MSDSERNMSEEEDEQFQSESSSMGEENDQINLNMQEKMTIQRVNIWIMPGRK